jgi:hypothetical protein
MLLPCAVLDTLLFLCALRPFVAPLLGALLPIVLVLPLLLLGVLLPIVLVLPLLLLGVLLPIVMVLPLLLLGVLPPIVLVLTLLLLGMLLLLSMLLFGLGLLVLALLLLGMVLLFALLLVLCINRSSDSEKQRQNNCAGDSGYFHYVLPPLRLGRCLPCCFI